jgi:predicted ATPase
MPPEQPRSADRLWQGMRADEPILGRATDLDQLCASLRQERRVVVTGPGGVGKTRLALAAAEQMRAAFPGGVAIVEAGGLPAEGGNLDQDLARLRQATFEMLHLLGRRDPEPLPDDSQTLLIIDNVEHVPTAVTLLARQLFTRYPRFYLIITSRRPVCTPEAPVWDVGPLAVDDAGQDGEAIDLFLRRTRLACPTLDLNGRMDEVRDLCAKLDGMPFALEMAALRLRSVSLDTLLRGDAITQLLGQARPADLPHHRTLADSVWWSYSLLTAQQRALLDQLAAISGPFTIEDVEQLPLCSSGPDSASPVPDVLSLLAEVVDASLVHVERGSRYSYRLLGYVREYILGLPMQSCTP